MEDDEFEWDDAKAASNLAKHDVSFEDARFVFDDDDWCELGTDTHSGETRFTNVGVVNGVVLHVTTVETERGRTRIISARKAARHEQRIYENQKRY